MKNACRTPVCRQAGIPMHIGIFVNNYAIGPKEMPLVHPFEKCKM